MINFLEIKMPGAVSGLLCMVCVVASSCGEMRHAEPKANNIRFPFEFRGKWKVIGTKVSEEHWDWFKLDEDGSVIPGDSPEFDNMYNVTNRTISITKDNLILHRRYYEIDVRCPSFSSDDPAFFFCQVLMPGLPSNVGGDVLLRDSGLDRQKHGYTIILTVLRSAYLEHYLLRLETQILPESAR